MTSEERAAKMGKLAIEHPDPAVREKWRQKLFEARGESAPPRQEVGGFEGMQAKGGTSESEPLLTTGLPADTFPASKAIEKRDIALGGSQTSSPTTGAPIPGLEKAPEFSVDKARNVLNEFGKKVSGGLSERAAKAVDPDYEARLKASQAKAPLSTGERAGIGLASILAGGVPKALGLVGEKLVEKALPAGISAVTGGAARGMGAAAAGGGGIPAMEELSENLGNRPTGEVMERAGKAFREGVSDPITLAAGTALGTITGASRGYLANNKNIQQIESQGGTVGVRTPGKGGLLDRPDVAAGIENGRVTEVGKGQVARDMAVKADKALAGRAGEVITADRAAREAAGPKLAEKADVTSVVDEALEKSGDAFVPRNVRGTIKNDVFDILDQRATFEPGGRVSMSVEDAQKLKQSLQDLADTANPRGSERHLGSLATGTREIVDKTPLGAINKQFAEGASKVENARGQLGFPEAARRVSDTGQGRALVKPEDEIAVANQLVRRGQDTVTAGMRRTPELQKALDDFPELGPITEAVPTLNARSALEFKAPGITPGNLHEKFKGFIGGNVEPVKARLLAPAGGQAMKVAPFIGDLSKAARKRMKDEKKEAR